MNDANFPQPANHEPRPTSSPAGDSPLHDEVRYETSEVSLKGLLAVLLAFALVFVGVFAVSGWILSADYGAAGRPASDATYSTPTDAMPSEPRLEPLEYETAIAMNVFAAQLEMERRLHGYGVTDDEGYVHIPIDEAIKRVAKSLPVRPGAEEFPAKSFGLVGGGEANSGRLYAEAPQWLREDQ